MVVLTAVAAIGGLTFLLATALILANRKLHVEEDPRIDVVEEMLPHANCGACGYPGCRPFAEALVSGATAPGKCSVSSDIGREAIAGYLGIAVGEQTRIVARLACAGVRMSPATGRTTVVSRPAWRRRRWPVVARTVSGVAWAMAIASGPVILMRSI